MSWSFIAAARTQHCPQLCSTHPPAQLLLSRGFKRGAWSHVTSSRRAPSAARTWAELCACCRRGCSSEVGACALWGAAGQPRCTGDCAEGGVR